MNEEEVTKRREFLKASVAAFAGLSFWSLFTKPAYAQQVRMMKSNMKLNAAAKSVMPDGSLLGRNEILLKLNLDPSTPPDAWLAIFSCGSNAGALGIRDIRVLMKRGVLKENMLLEHQLKLLRQQ